MTDDNTSAGRVKGIIFSGPMVRALLDGRKTQTRRLFKPGWGLGEFVNLKDHGDPGIAYSGRADDPFSWGWPYAEDGVCDMSLGQWPDTSGYSRGDRLYVRETALYWYRNSDNQRHKVAAYRADGYELERRERWEPSIHMPRWASRLWLLVTDVRVQRVQDISDEDIWCECDIDRWAGDYLDAKYGKGEGAKFRNIRLAFAELWNSLHNKPGERWDDNPWVVAITFAVHRGNIDASTASAVSEGGE